MQPVQRIAVVRLPMPDDPQPVSATAAPEPEVSPRDFRIADKAGVATSEPRLAELGI